MTDLTARVHAVPVGAGGFPVSLRAGLPGRRGERLTTLLGSAHGLRTRSDGNSPLLDAETTIFHWVLSEQQIFYSLSSSPRG